MSYILRPYQEEAVKKAIEYLNKPKSSKGVIVAPTGAGKSLIIAELARRLNSSVLVLQPSKELLEQNYGKYISYGNKASIYSASMNLKETEHRVIFGTIGTVYNSYQNFVGIRYVIIDECHLACKKSSRIDKFIRLLNLNKVIGLTATPLELVSTFNKETMENSSHLEFITSSYRNIFKDIIHITQIKDIVDQGFWCDLDYFIQEVDASRLEMNSNGSDFTDNSVRDHYKFNNLKSRIRQEVERQIANGRKSILIFMPSIDDAKDLERIIPGCRAVYSGMDKKDRAEIVEGFKNLTIPVISNVNILSVGFDHPELDTIIMARPTNSFAIYYQQAGRGVRIHPNKSECVLIDFSDNLSRFGVLEEIEFLRDKKGKHEMFNKDRKLSGYVTETREKALGLDGSPHILKFGMHKGRDIKDVPSKYLRWMLEKFDFAKHMIPLKEAVEQELSKRVTC